MCVGYFFTRCTNVHQPLEAGPSVFSCSCVFFLHFLGEGEEGSEFSGYFMLENLMLVAVNTEYVS